MMDTPSHELTTSQTDIFEHLTEPVESVQDYRPGGLHPVYLRDVLGDRYEVVRKLGYGGFSTVWLAVDLSTTSWIALKIMRADSSATTEIKVYETLQTNASEHPGYACIMHLKDHFLIKGPNGSHDCLAYEVMGSSISSVLQDSNNSLRSAFLTISSGRKIAHQLILGLDCMHSVGIAHGDIYASNLLFNVTELPETTCRTLFQSHDAVTTNVRRVEGSVQVGDPRHLTLNDPLSGYLDPKGSVKLSDLGSAFFDNDPPSSPKMPADLRSPEMIFSNGVSIAQDLWAAGCLIYYLFTKQYPIDLSFLYDQESRNDSHMIQLTSLLGPLPEYLRDSWPRYSEYYDQEGKLQKFDVDDDSYLDDEMDALRSEDSRSTISENEAPTNDNSEVQVGQIMPSLNPMRMKRAESFPELYPQIVKTFERISADNQDPPNSVAEYEAMNPPLRETWLRNKHPDMEAEEAELILDLLQNLLTYDPRRRLSTKDMLQHPWVKKYCTAGNSDYNASETIGQDVGRMKRKRSS